MSTAEKEIQRLKQALHDHAGALLLVVPLVAEETPRQIMTDLAYSMREAASPETTAGTTPDQKIAEEGDPDGPADHKPQRRG